MLVMTGSATRFTKYDVALSLQVTDSGSVRTAARTTATVNIAAPPPMYIAGVTMAVPHVMGWNVTPQILTLWSSLLLLGTPSPSHSSVPCVRHGRTGMRACSSAMSAIALVQHQHTHTPHTCTATHLSACDLWYVPATPCGLPVGGTTPFLLAGARASPIGLAAHKPRHHGHSGGRDAPIPRQWSTCRAFPRLPRLTLSVCKQQTSRQYYARLIFAHFRSFSRARGALSRARAARGNKLISCRSFAARKGGCV